MTELISKQITISDTETEAAGAALARTLLQTREHGCTFVAMYGDLGVGKTAFVRGAATVLAPGARIQSPTYTIVNEYDTGAVPLLHFDMYRIDSEDDLYSVGFWDYMERDAFAFVEWSEKIPFALPDAHHRVTISKTDKPEERQILIERVTEA